METKTRNVNTYVLNLIKNMYVQRQVVKLWNKYLNKNLLAISFKQSAIDECVFF